MKRKIQFTILVLLFFVINQMHIKNISLLQGESIITYMKSMGYMESKLSGAGVCVAVLDTGISNHADIIDNLIYFKDFTDVSNYKPYDDNGHGSAVAGILEGNGSLSNGKYCGIAPDINLISLKVFDHEGNANIQCIEDALNWILYHINQYNIDIVCMPLGYNAIQDERDPLYSIINNIASSVIVVAAAGNNNTIGNPGYIDNVISVGSIDNTKIRNNRYKVANFSASFLSHKLTNKPEMFSPGVNIIVPSIHAKEHYTVMSGTSMSTACVAGYIALLMEKYKDMSLDDMRKYVLSQVDQNGVMNFGL